MDIANIVSTDFVELPPDTRVSKLGGVFDDPATAGVIVRDDEFRGVITRRQLATSHVQPDQKLASLVWQVPRVAPDEDIRAVAGLMIDSSSQVLPVFEGPTLTGVVTADGVLKAVQEFLDAVRVSQAASTDLVTVAPGTTFGEVLHVLRENRITHLPVVDEDAAVGILSLYDVVPLVVRAATRSQGGDAGGTNAAAGANGAGRGGFGAREGEIERMLDQPVRDLMSEPVRTIHPDETLETAVATMFEIGGSSLVVTENGSPFGIVTKTDALEALTWEAEGSRAVQVYGTDLLDDMRYDEIVAMVEAFEDRDRDTTILDAKVHLHEHDETLRGTPLLLARIRLHTDRGLFIASGEGYGAGHAIREARDVIERQLRDEKTRGRSKKHPDEAFWEKRFGWLLESAE